eukprot:m.202888 g.202888  ORF g.202888 m.202888 type:complete len:213 (+) comp14981_c0_seq14:86-724(+)
MGGLFYGYRLSCCRKEQRSTYTDWRLYRERGQEDCWNRYRGCMTHTVHFIVFVLQSVVVAAAFERSFDVCLRLLKVYIVVVDHLCSKALLLVTGYNGMPRGCSDDALPWAKQGDCVTETKYPYVCTAEMNAILNRNSSSLKGCTMYVMLFPDCSSAKLMIQAGIKEVVYVKDDVSVNHVTVCHAQFSLARCDEMRAVAVLERSYTILHCAIG